MWKKKNILQISSLENWTKRRHNSVRFISHYWRISGPWFGFLYRLSLGTYFIQNYWVFFTISNIYKYYIRSGVGHAHSRHNKLSLIGFIPIFCTRFCFLSPLMIRLKPEVGKRVIPDATSTDLKFPKLNYHKPKI